VLISKKETKINAYNNIFFIDVFAELTAKVRFYDDLTKYQYDLTNKQLIFKDK